MAEFASNVWFGVFQCCNCGIDFAVTKDFEQRRRDDHKLFYCPNGHSQLFTGITAKQKLERDLERTELDLQRARIAQRQAESDRENIAKAHRKMRARIMNGVCPCCNRTFQNLRDHMKTQHSDFGTEHTILALRTAFGMTQQAVADEAGLTAPQVSNYERGKPVALYVKERLDRWADTQSAA